jgi:hypothetical protein
MVSKNVILGIVMLSFINCISCREDKVYFLAQSDKYIPLMADLYLLQVAVEQAPEQLRDSLAKDYKQRLYKLHHTDAAELSILLDDLTSHPREALIFYDSLSVFMQARENKSINEDTLQ